MQTFNGPLPTEEEALAMIRKANESTMSRLPKGTDPQADARERLLLGAKLTRILVQRLHNGERMSDAAFEAALQRFPGEDLRIIEGQRLRDMQLDPHPLAIAPATDVIFNCLRGMSLLELETLKDMLERQDSLIGYALLRVLDGLFVTTLSRAA